jgi:hypothetical protein
MIPDRFFYPLIALVVAALIALAMEWPQGEGERSWGRFGQQTVAEKDAAAAAAARRAEALRPPPPPPPAAQKPIDLK